MYAIIKTQGKRGTLQWNSKKGFFTKRAPTGDDPNGWSEDNKSPSHLNLEVDKKEEIGSGKHFAKNQNSALKQILHTTN